MSAARRSRRLSRVDVAVQPGLRPRLARAAIVRRTEAMVRALQLQEGDISLLLTGDDQIQELNRVYRKKNRPTDVLAFAQREGKHGDVSGEILGDVVVSVPTAARQASAAGRPLVDEVTMLIAHGILHLLGWDHETEAKDRAMRAETERLCRAAARAQMRFSRAR